jgi:hypothetical protein
MFLYYYLHDEGTRAGGSWRPVYQPTLQGDISMTADTDFLFPKEEYRALLKAFYSEINGRESFDPPLAWQGENWSSRVIRSRGSVLEKAGFTTVNIANGIVNDSPGSIRLFETLAYPASPCIPGLIIMTNMNRSEAMGTMIVFYTDMIIQDGRAHSEEKQLYADALKAMCDRHGRSFKEYNAFGVGQGILGGNAAECGFLNFFTEEDISFLDDVIREALPAYRAILNKAAGLQATQDDVTAMYRSRARFVEWFLTENIGHRIAKSNNIPLETIEAYGFPPVIKY